MNSIAHKLSRVAALRPRSPMPDLPDSGLAANSEKLIQLLGGEIQTNRLGSHIRVRRLIALPRTVNVDFRALRRITPHPVESLRDSGQWLFLDTETTGLAGGTGTYAFLVGLGWWEEDDFVVEQHFMREHGEERSLLLEVSEHFAKRRVLVTFNGKTFDWPLLQTRYQIARIGSITEPWAHLDLLHPARQLWRVHLRSVALAQLEQHILKLDRGQDIPSETIPQRYFDFLRGSQPDAVVEVFRHNQMDLFGLASLALHMIRILQDPEKSDCVAGELFGISRLLQKRGEDRLARRIYQRALEGDLPKAAEKLAQRELALMAKREQDFELANALWEKLLDSSAEGLRAYEQLAMYYEHYALLPQRAAALTREALARLQDAFHMGRVASHIYLRWHASFQHRLTRLTAKIENTEIIGEDELRGPGHAGQFGRGSRFSGRRMRL
jgi:uncharacterized protein YprB with RNaseH-like and TPR domain